MLIPPLLVGADAGGSLRNSWRPEIAQNKYQDLGELPSLNTHKLRTKYTEYSEYKLKTNKNTKIVFIASFNHPTNQQTNKQPLVISLFQEAGRQTCGSEG